MKKLIAIIIFLALIAVPAMAGNDEPQKYQVDFTLRYNAVDAETMAKILIALEQLKKQAGSVKLEPCKWDVTVKKAEGMADYTASYVWSIAYGECYCFSVTRGFYECPCSDLDTTTSNENKE